MISVCSVAETIQERFARLAGEWARAEVPYQHRGMSRQGCDCTGLLIGIARELGYLRDYQLRKYPPDWNLHAGAGNQVIEEICRFAEPIDKSQAGPGDIAVMLFGKCPAHVGLIVDDKGLIVHALKTNGCCTYGHLQNSTWSSRWIAAYRLKEEKLKND